MAIPSLATQNYEETQNHQPQTHKRTKMYRMFRISGPPPPTIHLSTIHFDVSAYKVLRQPQQHQRIFNHPVSVGILKGEYINIRYVQVVEDSATTRPSS